MKGNISSAAAFLILILLSPYQNSHSKGLRNFSNTSGKVIRASIVSATGEEVTLKLENGKTITGGTNFFSKADQAYIKDWVKKNPVQIKHEFDLRASRSRIKRDKRSEGNHIVIYETWIYKIQLENRSRAGTKGADINGYELQYNVVFSPKAKITKSGSRPKGISSSGRHAVKKGKQSLGELKYLTKKEYATDSFPINKSELAPGWYYTNGSKDEKSDELEGIIIKVFKGEEEVFEKRIGAKTVDNLKWVAP